jgi:S1-C subfamily serine protease
MSKFWRHFLTNGGRQHAEAYLGIDGRRVQLSCAATGVEVRGVTPGSPAEDAGLLEGDVLVCLGGRATHGIDDLHQVLADLPADVPLPARFLRRGRWLERWVLLADV